MVRTVYITEDWQAHTSVLEALTPSGGRDAQLQLHSTHRARLLQCQQKLIIAI